jgi:RND family efflux transporter MFP subunit
MPSEDIAERAAGDETRRLLKTLTGSRHDTAAAPEVRSRAAAHSRWLWAVAGAAVFATAIYFVRQDDGRVDSDQRAVQAKSAPANTPPPAPSPAAEPGDVLQASGFVVATREATVSAETTGRVVRLLVSEGSRVERGQTIAELDASVQQAQVEHARARVAASEDAVAVTESKVAAARRNLERSRSLIKRGFISQSQLDEATDQLAQLEAQLVSDRSQIKVARKELALESKQLDNTRIAAPFDGVVTELAAHVGEIVSPISAGGGFTRTGICTIVDLSSLEGEIDVNEQYLGRIAGGQGVSVTSPAYPSLRIEGHVDTVTAAVDRSTAAVKVRIAFDEAPGKLIPGMRIDAAFAATPGLQPARPPQAKNVVPPPLAGEGRVGDRSEAAEGLDAAAQAERRGES